MIKNIFNFGTLCKKNEEKYEVYINKTNIKDMKGSNLKLRRQDTSRNQKSHKASKFHLSSSPSSSSTSSLCLLKPSKNFNNLSKDDNNRKFHCANSVTDSGIEMNIFKVINRKALSETSLNSNINNYVENIRSSSSSKSLSSAVKLNIKKSDSESALRSLFISTSSYNGSFENVDYIEKYSTNDTSNLFLFTFKILMNYHLLSYTI